MGLNPETYIMKFISERSILFINRTNSKKSICFTFGRETETSITVSSIQLLNELKGETEKELLLKRMDALDELKSIKHFLSENKPSCSKENTLIVFNDLDGKSIKYSKDPSPYRMTSSIDYSYNLGKLKYKTISSYFMFQSFVLYFNNRTLTDDDFLFIYENNREILNFNLLIVDAAYFFSNRPLNYVNIFSLVVFDKNGRLSAESKNNIKKLKRT